MKRSISLPNQIGYTMIELLITLSIVALVASAAGPNLRNAINKSERSACLGEAVAMLNLARSEAVGRQRPVALCSSSDQTSCNSNNWEDGWLMFVDDGSGSAGVAIDRDINGDEQKLHVSESSCNSAALRSANLTDAGGITFLPDGMTTDRGTLVVCDDSGTNNATAVVLNISGQPRLATDMTGDGIVEDDTGVAVSCS